ncbi:MAG: Xaa-Pro dipeptidase [Candidatus Paceibacterota bacterium]|jgi:Xaa-Pro dipeptidase
MNNLFKKHVISVVANTKLALKKNKLNTLVVHSGTPDYYAFDDEEKLFRPLTHFNYFSPLTKPECLLVIGSGKPKLFILEPADYWYERSVKKESWMENFVVTKVESTEKIWEKVKILLSSQKASFIGDASSAEKARNIIADKKNINNQSVIEALNELRTQKTDYEVACIKEANKIAMAGHKAAKKKFLEGGTEKDIHNVFSLGANITERDFPYGVISALNEKGAILHYQNKRDVGRGKVLLMDAGAKVNGYASDITRTWVKPGTNKMFETIVKRLNILQLDLCNKIKPGVTTLVLHHEAHLGVAKILQDAGIIKISGEEAIKAWLTFPFFPHGLGHFLGIQTHDVGSTNITDNSALKNLKTIYPKLRTVRRLEERNAITVEPGIYFIPILLGQLKKHKSSKLVNWKLVETLLPYGGVRIEDNVLVTKNGHLNLTRPFENF